MSKTVAPIINPFTAMKFLSTTFLFKSWAVASTLEKTARDSNLFTKKVAVEQVFGSNLVLAGGQAGFKTSESGAVAPQNQWAALRAALRMVGQKPESQILERVRRIELPSLAWEANVLPLYNTRINIFDCWS